MEFRVISENAKVTSVGCGGVEAYDAEVVIEVLKSNGKSERLYIHASAMDGKYYTLSKESIMELVLNADTDALNKLENCKYLEEYTSARGYNKSEYAEAFKIADRMLKDLLKF